MIPAVNPNTAPLVSWNLKVSEASLAVRSPGTPMPVMNKYTIQTAVETIMVHQIVLEDALGT